MRPSVKATFFDWTKAETITPQKQFEFIVTELRKHPRFNWVGIYWIDGSDLELRAWNGPEATEHVRIPIGQGICGLAARTGKTVNVPDVNADPHYLACFLNTRSELVVPIKSPDGKVLGEIDIDSDTKGLFPLEDVAVVEKVADWLGRRAA